MKKEFWAATIFIVFIAAWLRFYDLTNYHGGLLLDEIWMALNARNLGEGVTVCCPLYFSLPFGGHPLFVYLSWLAQLFFAPPFAGRTLSATLGTLSVLSLIFILYSLSRSKLLALVGGFTLATTVSHITFSRAGLETLLPSVIAIPLIWLIYQTYQKESWRYALLCGIVLGLSFYSYAPAAAFPIAALAFAAWRFVSLRNTQYASRIQYSVLRITLIILIVSLLCITPFLYTLLFTPNQYFSHLLGTTQATRSGNIFLSLIENTLRVIGGVSIEGQVTGEHNFQGQPLFNPVVSLFFWIGLLISIIGAWRKQPAPQLMIVWAVCTSLPTLFSDHAPNFARWLQALPALVFFVGVGVMWSWERLSLLATQNNRNCSASLRRVFFAFAPSLRSECFAKQSH
ncbi:MAG: glycosyltransferase family 39 protein, partial [Chloroflexota bacterium]